MQKLLCRGGINVKFNKQLESLLEQMYNFKNRKHDAYYDEGIGATFVIEGQQPNGYNTVLFVSEQELHMLSMGATMNFNLNF